MVQGGAKIRSFTVERAGGLAGWQVALHRPVVVRRTEPSHQSLPILLTFTCFRLYR